MKSLYDLWRATANELAVWCCTSAARDIKTVASRIEHEGEEFLYLTLPTFGKALERALEEGRVDSNSFAGFKRGRGPLPLFLGGFLSQVFDPCDGQLLQEPNIDCIFAVRELTLMFGKILVPCTPARTRDAIEGYLECEQEVQMSAESITEEGHHAFQRVAGILWSDCFNDLERRIQSDASGSRQLLPRHGPGATADRLHGNAKYNQREWPLRMQGIFPYEEFALAYPLRHHIDAEDPSCDRYDSRMDHVSFLDPEMERPVRVITVPKTPKTDRIIAIEPTCMQYMQQALMAEMVDVLERDTPDVGFYRRFGRPDHSYDGVIPRSGDRTAADKRDRAKYIPSSFLGFNNQEPNRILAELGSQFGHLATLDLSEASDRVSVRHVEDLMSRWPLLREAVMAVRSTKAAIPGKFKHDPDRVIDLHKYASMGSALCFPVEAMVFVTTVFVGVERALSRPLTQQDLIGLVGKVRVFGDDIIVPVEFVHSVVQTLESYGFKVNRSKSFWNGKFRESCGGDYYDGTDITLIRVRRKLPSMRRNAQEVNSLVELRNQMYFLGLWQTSSRLDKAIEGILGNQYYPIVEPSSPVIGRNSAFLRPSASGWDEDSHVPLVKGYVLHERLPRNELDGDGALLKFFLKRGDEATFDKEHLERSGRPLPSTLKKRWMRPY